MDDMTTSEQINKRVRDGEANFVQGLIDQAMSQANLPRCDLCKKIVVSGAMNYNDIKGNPLMICMPCITRAITLYLNTFYKAK